MYEELLHILWQINYKEDLISITFVTKTAGTINFVSSDEQWSFSTLGECKVLLSRIPKQIYI